MVTSVEGCCLFLLHNILPQVDSKRGGICIDVGVGTFAFYCEMFSMLGFETVAVEPLPIKSLRSLCEWHKIKLIEGCLSDINGTQNLYVGTWANDVNFNFSSLASDWFGSSTEARKVQSLTLLKLLSKVKPKKLACLKIDVEGMELSIIKQLVDLPKSLLPKVVMFEYGGASSRKDGKNGWSDKFLKSTMTCLSVLKKCGYSFSIMVDAVKDMKEKIFDLQVSDIDPDSIFPLNASYGNIILLRDFYFKEKEIADICSLYYLVEEEAQGFDDKSSKNSNIIKTANKFKREGRLDEAILWYRRSIEKNPNFYFSHYNLAEVLAKKGCLDEAITEYYCAIDIKPDSAYSYYSLGQTFTLMEKYDEAAKCFQKATELNPKMTELINSAWNRRNKLRF
ncbi:MAG: FkbM family methyltransferase [Okeania sp. SIO3B3]|nr:FkbM family methyltransferase [Okeania sp. SIO3B3]